jgi:ketosteroid isomerase-like protein
MASNIDVIKGAYEAFSKGKAEDAVDAFAEDAVWQGADSTELPGGGEHRGRDAIVQAMESVGIEWDSFELTPDEFFEDGDTVVVLGHSEVSKGGNSGKLPVVHVARFEDGKVKRFQALTDTLLAAQKTSASRRLSTGTTNRGRTSAPSVEPETYLAFAVSMFSLELSAEVSPPRPPRPPRRHRPPADPPPAPCRRSARGAARRAACR